MGTKRTDGTGDPGGDDLWQAPTSPTPRPVPAMPPPTGPRVGPPTAAEKRQGARKALVVVAIVGAALIAIGVFFAVFAAPIFNAQSAKAADTNAKADVSTLGRDIATYFVDADYGSPPPEITIVDGRYHLDVGSSYFPYDDEPVSPGVRFGGVSGTGALDWCVWVTNPGGDYKDFQYSAQHGLEAGSC